MTFANIYCTKVGFLNLFLPKESLTPLSPSQVPDNSWISPSKVIRNMAKVCLQGVMLLVLSSGSGPRNLKAP